MMAGRNDCLTLPLQSGNLLLIVVDSIHGIEKLCPNDNSSGT